MNRPFIFRLTPCVLPLAFAMALSSCNKGDSLLSGGQQLAETESNVAERKFALMRVATQLETQKRLMRAQKEAASLAQVDVASLEIPAVQTSGISGGADIAALPQVEPVANNSGPLGRLHAKLAGLQSGKRHKPVTILHLGGSHVASDSFSRGIRTALQARYGNAGRGMVLPAKAFGSGAADQVKISASGNWRSDTALNRKGGRFGLSGVSVSSRSSKSSMRLVSQSGEFDWAEVTVSTGPSQGQVSVKVGGVERVFEANSKVRGSKTFRVNARGNVVEVKPGGGARTTVLNWATGKNLAGIRYVNFGLTGATLELTKRFDMTLVANDVRRLDPDLIIFGYGTNEGVDHELNLAAYRKHAAAYMKKLLASAPNADVVYLGSPSGLRKKGNGACGGWSIPPKLEPLRASVRKLAVQQNAAYWDWSASMGGRCAMNTWVRKGLAETDRVHLTNKGYRRSAKAFSDWLVQPAISNAIVVLN